MRAKTIAMIALALGLANQCYADAEQMLAKLKGAYPNTNFSRVTESSIPGLYEIMMGQNIAYATEDVRYFVFGHMFDMKERRDLTAEKEATLPPAAAGKIAAALPGTDGIRIVKGNGKRKVSIFSDPTCGYCKQLEREIANVTDVTITTYLLPILSDKSREVAAGVWCSSDQPAAWRDWMSSGKAPQAPAASCDANSVLDRNLALAQKHGIRGTPTIVLSDGTLVPGAAKAATLEVLLK